MTYYPVKNLRYFRHANVSGCTRIYDHIIDYYDLTLILEGSMTYYANGEKIVLQKNDGLFLKPGTVRARDDSSEQVHYVSFNFYASEGVDLPFENYMPNCIDSTIRKTVSIFPYERALPLNYSKEKCANLLNYILLELLTAISIRPQNEYTAKILNYIENNLTEKLTLTTISSYLNLSKEYTCTIFKKEIGKTITEYINERKMLRAKDHIEVTNCSLPEVAELFGYEDYNYFSRLFKKYLGVTPISVQKQRNLPLQAPPKQQIPPQKP